MTGVELFLFGLALFAAGVAIAAILCWARSWRLTSERSAEAAIRRAIRDAIDDGALRGLRFEPDGAAGARSSSHVVGGE